MLGTTQVWHIVDEGRGGVAAHWAAGAELWPVFDNDRGGWPVKRSISTSYVLFLRQRGIQGVGPLGSIVMFGAPGRGSGDLGRRCPCLTGMAEIVKAVGLDLLYHPPNLDRHVMPSLVLVRIYD
jgi:hypothetical protein